MSVYNLMGIIFSAILGFLFLGQIPTPHTIIGGFLVIGASLLLFFYKKKWLERNPGERR